MAQEKIKESALPPTRTMKTSLSSMSADDLSALIDNRIIGTHAERNRAILKRHMIDGVCYEPLAEEFDLSPRQVKTIIRRTLAILIKYIV